MIRRLEIRNYKIARRVTLDLEDFQVLVGPNGSGKSTVIDAIVFLSDLLRFGVQQTIRKRARSLRELTWEMNGGPLEFALEVELPEPVISKTGTIFQACRYEISIGASKDSNGLGVVGENFFLAKQVVRRKSRHPRDFPVDMEKNGKILHVRTPEGYRRVFAKTATEGSHRYTFRAETTNWNFPFEVLRDSTGLRFLPADPERFRAGTFIRRLLETGVQFLHLDVEQMRQPSPPDAEWKLAPDGSNLAMTVYGLQASEPELFSDWVKHVRGVLPEFSEIRVREREEDRHLVLELVKQDGIAIPMWLLSDGTLRLLAATIIAYIPGENELYLIEEPENGIHPTAIEAVHESLRSAYGKQIIVATHNPLFVGLTDPDQLLCFGKTPGGAVDVVRGSEHPRLRHWKREIDLGTYYASGVLD